MRNRTFYGLFDCRKYNFTKTLDAIKESNKRIKEHHRLPDEQDFDSNRYLLTRIYTEEALKQADEFEQHCNPNLFILAYYEELRKRSMRPEDCKGFFSRAHIAAFTDRDDEHEARPPVVKL